MQERILLAPGANPTELLRTLARHGCSTFALRITGSVELARLALMRSGISEEYTFIPGSEEPKLICRAAGSEDINYAAARDMARALHTMRMLIAEDEAETVRSSLRRGVFEKKNALISEIYSKYMSLCAAGEKPLMDRVAVIRLAAEKASPIDAEFITLKEYPLSPLERRMLNRISPDGPRELCLPELFGQEEKTAVSIDSMTSAYGSSNEIEDIIGRIYENRLPLDSCTVAVADSAGYSQLFYNYHLRHGIPMTFGCGVPVINTNPAHLLQLYLEWATHGCRGVDALRGMIMSESFDRGRLLRLLSAEDGPAPRLLDVITMTGLLRLGEDKAVDEQRIAARRRLANDIEDADKRASELRLIEQAEILCSELEKDCADFVAEYSVIRPGLPGRIDLSAAGAVRSALSGDVPLEEAAEAVLSSLVCPENSKEGHLHITDISGARCAIREHLFVAGLSASKFPGTPTENYLLLDNDYTDISDDEYAPLSDRRIIRKKKTLNDLVLLASALGSSVHLSYPCISLATLEEENPSSSMFELYCSAYGSDRKTSDFEGQLRHVGFFDRTFSALSLVGAEYMSGRIVQTKSKEEEPQEDSFSICPDRTFSPTAIEKYLQCPRKFYLNVLLGLQSEEKDDPRVILPVNALGNMIHQLMADCSADKPDHEHFMAKANRLFDEHLICRPPVNEADVDAVRREYLTLAENAYNSDPGNEVSAAEQAVSAVHPGTGLKLRGYPDRIEKLPSGEEIITDYKTGRRIKHTAQDADSCIQALLYAYMCKQNGHNVTGCEYRYPRYNLTVPCAFDRRAEERIDSILTSLKNAMDIGYFPAIADDCSYCPVADICGKEGRTGE